MCWVGNTYQVVREFFVFADNNPLPRRVETGAARAAEDLLHVQHGDVDVAAALRVVDLRALDDDRVRGQVDAPRQRRRRHEHLDVPVGEEVLHERAVGARHAGVVDGEAVRQQVLQVRAARRLRLLAHPHQRGGQCEFFSLQLRHPRVGHLLPRCQMLPLPVLATGFDSKATWIGV